MTAKNQLMREEARKLFDYRDGGLYWRHASTGHRKDRLAITVKTKRNRVVRSVDLGGVEYKAHYLIWNWHNGITAKPIRFADGDASNLRIENLSEMEASNAKFIRVKLGPRKLKCPCCNHRVVTPTLDVVVMNCDLSPLHERILSVIWSAKGRPVMTDRIFQAMYIDDPEGGPSPNKMYGAFKVALHHMRTRLEGSGVSIVNDGYRQGYRLVLGGN
jgi:hypothetical protein